MYYLVREMCHKCVVDLSLGGGLEGLEKPHGKAQDAEDAGGNIRRKRTKERT